MINTVRINADHVRDFHPLADHMITFKNVMSPRVEFLSCHRFHFHFN